MLRLSIAALVFAYAVSTSAANNFITGATVNKLRAYQKGYNGTCVFGISVNVNTEGPNPLVDCAENFLVTPDCAGEKRSKSDGQLMFETAQIAFVTGKTIDLLVTNDADLVGAQGLCGVKSVYISAN